MVLLQVLPLNTVKMAIKFQREFAGDIQTIAGGKKLLKQRSQHFFGEN